MLRKSYTLEVAECEVTGEIGFFVHGLNFDQIHPEATIITTTPDVIAHDIFEHVRGVHRIGTVYDELLALGALWYTRGQFGSIRPNSNDPVYGIATDVHMLAGYVENGTDFPRIRPQEPTDFDEDLEAICEEARVRYENERDAELDYFEIDRFLKYAKRGMQRGIHVMQRRYPNPLKANGEFWAITRGVEPLFEKHDSGDTRIGSQYRLRRMQSGEWDTTQINW